MYHYLELMDNDQQQHLKSGNKPLAVEAGGSFPIEGRYPKGEHCAECLLQTPNLLQ